MRKLNRAPAIRPANWARVAQSAVPDAAAFQQDAQAFEALPLTDPVRRAGFIAYAPQCLKSKGAYSSNRWGKYKKPIAEISHWQCAYCECTMNSERVCQVEHFKPKSLFPLSAYDWDNSFDANGDVVGIRTDASQTITDFELKRKLLNDDRRLVISTVEQQLIIIAEIHA
ncbi:MAG: hypothetical protein IPP47_23020 [Bryobacterales bacterium]|nr:hypothetical protein [Bryobacterales bacterium]